MSAFHEEAARARERRRVQQNRSSHRDKLKIYDCMLKCSPNLESPLWFDPYVQALDSVIDEKGNPQELLLCFSGPPQHGKTEISKHALVSISTRAPGLCHGYATYSNDRGREVAEKVKTLCQIAGLNPRLRDGTLWLDGGTEIRFVGPGGALTGNPINGLMLIDDILKDRQDAESKTIRESIWNWFTDIAQTRRHPGSSVVAMMTRWHIDDLIGRLIKELKWKYLRIPAECDSEDDPLNRALGEYLWPNKRPESFMQQFKVNPYTWASMYQGRPRPRGDSLFGEPHWYDELPNNPYVRGHGADLAYTEKTRADWSVLLSGRRYGEHLYLTNELRKQCQAPEFTNAMKARQQGKGRILWLCSGTEKGVAQMIRKQIPQFGYRLATADKYQRATPAAEDFWNVGKLLLPSKADWTNQFVDEICGFSGVGDLCDDRVDALAAFCLLLGRKIIGQVRHDMAERARKTKTKTAQPQDRRTAFRT